MGARFLMDRHPDWADGFIVGLMWCTSGRWYKRRLSKARRQFNRALCRDEDRAWQHIRSLRHWERECNWKAT